jgi:hypothetical protein
MRWLQRYRRNTIKRALKLWSPLFVIEPEDIEHLFWETRR